MDSRFKAEDKLSKLLHKSILLDKTSQKIDNFELNVIEKSRIINKTIINNLALLTSSVSLTFKVLLFFR